ncbi:MAG: AAA family ATPase [Alphaproteobacteria bacterium]
MVDARSLADIRIDPPKDWLDAPPLEAAPDYWGAVPVDMWGHEAPSLAPDPEPKAEPLAAPANSEAILNAAGAVIETPPRQYGRLRVHSVAEILNAPPRAYLLRGLFAVAELVVLWGQPKTGKSFLALRLAYGLALGQGMWGRKAPRPLRVLYVAAEGAGGMGPRLQALREALGDDEGRFAIIAQPAQIGWPGEDAGALREAAKAHAADLVIIDTLARTFGEGNEDAAQDMGQFVAECDAIRHETGAAVVVVHHGAKDEGAKTPRGSGALMGAADLILQVKKGAEGAPSVAIVQAAKDDEDGAELPFRLEVVTVGEREDGSPISTCLAIEAEPGRAGGGGAKLPPAARKAVDYLQDMIAEGRGAPLPSGTSFPDARGLEGVPVEAWRAECEARGLSLAESADNRRRAIGGAMRMARQAGAVAVRDGIAWPVRRAGA